jgi:hypothetical protein
MERLFSPCTRLHDILESQGRLEPFREDYPEDFQELKLDVSTKELLSAERAFIYANLDALFGNQNTVAWLTPHAAVVRNHGIAVIAWLRLNVTRRLDVTRCFRFNADGTDIVAVARSSEHLLEIRDIVVRLLAMSEVHQLILFNWTHDALIDAPILEYLMEQCQSVEALTLENLIMDEDHCHVLDVYSRPDLEIVLRSCKITSAGAGALAQVLGRNQGPTELDDCCVDNFVLANGLRGNSRLQSLSPRLSDDLEVRKRQVLAIAGALRENKGLFELNLRYTRMTDDMWAPVCDSLMTHPTLEVLDLRWNFMNAALVPAVLESRVHALGDMMKTNMSIRKIQWDACYSQHELFRRSVIPYLETNRFRPSVRAIQKTRPITYRVKVLERALLSARTDINKFWMLLSGNAEVAFPSGTTTIAATTLPDTPTTAAATSTANVTAVATSLMSALTTTAAGSLPIAAAASTNATSAAPLSDVLAFASTATAASVATLPAGQKRKSPHENPTRD